jgi:INO80 complex subunit C
LAEQLSYLNNPRPFKNPYYNKNVNRRAKNLKTVLTQEREKDRLRREALRQARAERTANGMDIDDGEDEEELNCEFTPL